MVELVIVDDAFEVLVLEAGLELLVEVLVRVLLVTEVLDLVEELPVDDDALLVLVLLAAVVVEGRHCEYPVRS